ncbi:sensor histidine kinase [Spartinivicinus ruber]|uniref:sensor histidine kinase n=1 Tax=Spartinivicinus ruber TaxID=2683272 RepID=UPI0013CF99A4|nr:ATP-binding protein [Spartinivicinus ruber]
MMADTSFPISSSVSIELFRNVFLFYLLVAITTTIFHVYIEFTNTRKHIETELNTISNAIESGLATSLWNMHIEQISTIIEGTQGLPVITGILLVDEFGSIVMQTGSVESLNHNHKINDLNPSISFSNVYMHSTSLQFTHKEGEKYVGNLILYSNSDIVFQRVKLGFALIVLNSIIKTAALWGLFITFSRIFISQPITELTNLVKKIDSNCLKLSSNISFSTKDNEISLLKRAFDTMLKELENSHKQLQSYASELEVKVAERTKELSEKEKKLRIAYRELEDTREIELDINSNKEKLVADISHELRTPLSILKLQFEALQVGLVDEKLTFEVFQRKLQQMERVVEDLSLVSDGDADLLKLKYEKFNGEKFIQEVIEPYEVLAHQNQQQLIYDNKPFENVTINADRIRLSQVLTNLLNNSLKYTNAGGSIKITTQKVYQKIIIKVEDSAPGVNDKDIKQLFTRLYRVEMSRNRKTGGSGLGLTLCKSFIDAHKGMITLKHSNLGGLLVEISLPHG